MSRVALTGTDGRWTLTLTDPDRRNCLDEVTCRELGEAIDAVASADDARTLVVAGEGKAFCAGADLPELFGDASERAVGELRRHLHSVYDSFLRLRRLTIPTVAAVQGAAVGAGLNLAMACDVRIAGPHASFAATFSRIGLHPGGGCTWFLVDALGPQRAMALLLDGGSLDGEAAVTQGLALELAEDPLGRAHELADRWAGHDPALTQDIKTAVGIAAGGDFDATLEFEAWAQASSATGTKIREVVERFRK